jgi:hypothetical protein
MDAKAAMQLSNVILDDKLLEGKRKSDITNIRVSAPLDEIMWKVVSENPTWEFRAGTSRNEVSRDVVDRSVVGVRLNRFDVFKDNEQIGSIGRNYRSSRMGGDYVFAISSNALKNERERNSEYCTKDAKKALAAIKKTFSNKSMSERMNEAFNDAARSISRESNEKTHTANKYLHRLSPTIQAFAFVTMQKEFEAYAQSLGMGAMLNEYKTAQLEMLTVDEIQTKFNTVEATHLVLSLGGKYVVKTGDKIDMYDDNTLPVEMRGKLGMLKLVEPEQMIEGVGCRATTEVFVLLAE